MKNEAVFKKSFNALLDHVGGLSRGGTLESESQLADILKVSRTTVRKALSELELRGLTRRDGNRLQARIVRLSKHRDPWKRIEFEVYLEL